MECLYRKVIEMKFLSVLIFIVIVFAVSFFCLWESFAQTLSENGNTQMKQALSHLPKVLLDLSYGNQIAQGNGNYIEPMLMVLISDS